MQHLFLAGIAFDGKGPLGHGRTRTLRAPIDDDNRHALPLKLASDDAANAAVAADDEMIFNLVEHAQVSSLLKACAESALDDDRGGLTGLELGHRAGLAPVAREVLEQVADGDEPQPRRSLLGLGMVKAQARAQSRGARVADGRIGQLLEGELP